MIATKTRPDIRLDRSSWDGRLAVETITRRGIEAFGDHFYRFARERYPAPWTKSEHDEILREFIAAEGLVVEGGDCE